MIIPAILVVSYILWCARYAAAPWRYFQLNARFFSNEHGIFSKVVLDRLIPERWRLDQRIDSPELLPDSYPVFLKPEWGQNSRGVFRIDSFEQLTKQRAINEDRPERFLLQQAASGTREFEIFSIDIDRDDNFHDVVTVTETVNDSETYPVNSKFNKQTSYRDITPQFTDAELQVLAGYLSELGQFGISRLSVRADSVGELLYGKFQVIEVNIFLPFPINLFDRNTPFAARLKFIQRAARALALATKGNVLVANPRPIFTLMMLYGRKRAKEARAYDRRAVRLRNRSVHTHHG